MPGNAHGEIEVPDLAFMVEDRVKVWGRLKNKTVPDTDFQGTIKRGFTIGKAKQLPMKVTFHFPPSTAGHDAVIRYNNQNENQQTVRVAGAAVSIALRSGNYAIEVPGIIAPVGFSVPLQHEVHVR